MQSRLGPEPYNIKPEPVQPGCYAGSRIYRLGRGGITLRVCHQHLLLCSN